MADSQELRRLIQDNPGLEIRKIAGYGDGSQKVFALGRKPIITDGLQVFIDGAEESSGNYTVDSETGSVTFTTAPASDEEISATCKYVCLSDAELDSILARNPGSIYLAAAEAIGMILAGRGRLASYSKGDAKIDLAAIRKDLKSLADHYRKLGGSAAGPRVESFEYPSVNDDAEDE